jgi:hypothetical protein
MRRSGWIIALAMVGSVLPASGAFGILVTSYTNMVPLGAPIRFDEISYGSVNPTYVVGPLGNQVSLTFGSHFVGQTLGGMPNTLSDSTPLAGLSFATGGPVATSIDMALGSIALGGRSGSAYFTTPISIRLHQPVSAIGFRTGHFDAPESILFEAYDSLGQSLGVVRNPYSAVGHMALRSNRNVNEIAGLSIYMLPGTMDWEGYTVDDVIVERGTPVEDGDVSSTPEPVGLGTLALLGIVPFLRRGCQARRNRPNNAGGVR